jgi:predicted nucleotidyltransferase
MTVGQLLQEKRAEVLRLGARHGAVRLRVFGSVARGEATGRSDVDFLVAFEPGRSLLDLVALRQDLEELLGRKVDLVSEGGVSPYLRERIFQEATPL